MNENIDLTKILKDCPKGWKLYSTIYGDVEFIEGFPRYAGGVPDDVRDNNEQQKQVNL